MSPEELEACERVISGRLYDGTYVKRIVLKLIKEVRRLDAWNKHILYQWDGSVKELTDYISKLEAECDMLAELMPDCPVKYGASVWCRRSCPVWGRHDDDGPDYYCTTAERREYARKEIERDEEDRVRREQDGGDETKDTSVGT